MKKFFLLIVNNSWTEKGKPVYAKDIAMHRLKQGYWSIYKNTPNKKSICEGDEVIIYIAGNGPNGKSFAAKATINGITTDKLKLSDLYGEPATEALILNNIEIFHTFPSILLIKDKLSFIPKTNKWGCVMQRGLRCINENDFNTIIDFVSSYSQ